MIASEVQEVTLQDCGGQGDVLQEDGIFTGKLEVGPRIVGGLPGNATDQEKRRAAFSYIEEPVVSPVE